MYTENDDRKKKKNDNLTRFNMILQKKMTITASYSQKKKKRNIPYGKSNTAEQQ